MPNKFELVTKLYYEICKDVVRSPQEWQRFLASACRNYRLRFDEQLLIYAQRPDATAVLEFDKWNKRFNRRINRNAKGISVFETVEKTKLKHYFDISDTKETETSRAVPIWEYKPEYEQAVIETLENTFGELSNKSDIVDAVISAAEIATEDNTVDIVSDLPRAKENSFLEEFDDDSISTIYHRLVKNSVAYMLLTRLGIDADEYFDREDFEGAVNFNTVESLNAIGYSTSDIAEIALNEVSKTVLSLEKENRIIAKSEKTEYTESVKENERGVSKNDGDHIQERGRSSASELGTSNAEKFDLEQIWADEEKVSQGGTPPDLLQPDDNRQAGQSSGRDRRESESNGAVAYGKDGGTGRLDGGTQGNGSDGLGTGYEQPETESTGNRDERGNIRPVSNELPSFIDENLILKILSNPDDDLKQKKTSIVDFFNKTSNGNERAEFIKGIYPDRYTELIFDEQRVGYVSSENGLLIWKGSYPSRTEESVFSWDIVTQLIGSIIDEGRYLPKAKEQESAQISLFDAVPKIPEEQILGESAQVSLFTDFGVSQQIIDEALCIGANDKNSTVEIAMIFRRDRGTEYNAEFLKNHYKTNGAGFLFNGEKVSLWYNENGLNISKGTTAQKSTATHITWEQAAKRIRELLDEGRYMPQDKLDAVDDYEINKLADRIVEFNRNVKEDYEGNDKLFPFVRSQLKDILGYPDEVEKITQLLDNPSYSEKVLDEYEKFMTALMKDGYFLRFEYAQEYTPYYTYEIVKGMRIEPVDFKTASDFNPDRQYFISNDEIENFLRGGKSSAEARFRIYTHLVNAETKEKRAKVLKDYYGISGSISGNDRIDSSSKGLEISHGDIFTPYAKVTLKWSQVEKHYDDMIKGNRFFYQSDFDQLENIYKRNISSSLESFFESLPNEYAKPYPADTENYRISDVLRNMLDNPQELESIEKMMSDAMALMSEESNSYKYRKEEYDDFIAFKNGTYSPYKLPERTEQKPATVSSRFSKPAEEETAEPEWLKSYNDVKAESSDSLAFYQVGDFFECYFDDATTVANELDLVLTSKANGDERIAMCGFPKHSLDEYMSRLAEKGYKAAVTTVENEETKTIFYIVDDKSSEDITEEIKDLPTPTVTPKSNPYTFDLHPEIPLDERHDFDFANHKIQDVNKKERFHRNYAAISVLKKCQSENRFATPDEQIILSRYVGWGGIPEAFDEGAVSWKTEYAMLKNILTPDEYASARKSTLTAFYTPQTVISAIYKALDNFGFKQGNILEPSCAIGNFIGMLPESMKDSKVYGIEIDNISAGIAQQLYQKSSIMTAPFEKAELPDSFFDAVVGNVPFGDYSLADKRYDKFHFLIHDYFFAKSLDKLRPGGVMCLITSKGTMDKENSDVRRYIAQRAELLGAIRLPDSTFKGSAGTDVTSDILILQKRDTVAEIEPDWIFIDEDANGIRMNKYFVEHPEMILGEMVMKSGRFGEESTCKAYEDRTLEEQLDVAVENIKGEIKEYEVEDIDEDDVSYIPAVPNVRNFSFTIVDGKIYFRENSVMREVITSETAQNRIRGMIEIRDCVKNLLEMQTQDYPDIDIEREQHRLNEVYDRFVKKYGYINSRGNSSAFSDDSSYFLICSLEMFKDGEFERKADMFTKRTIQPHIAKTHADTAIEAFGISIGEKGKIDMPFMCQLTGKSEEEIYADLKGVIFLNPMYNYGGDNGERYLPADEYLSGNVRKKLEIAKKSAELYPDDYTVNVEALEKVQPVDLKANEITVTLGATWIPIEIINRFMHETFQTPFYTRAVIRVHYNELANVWNIENKSADNGNITVTQKYGTSRKNAFHILESTLNMRNVKVFDYEEDENGKRVAILNKKETAIAQSKQELIKQTFKEWIWKDPERREKLCKMYNEKFNSNRPREYDGSHIVFEGMNPEITLRKHQQDAVARILYGGNTLLAHCVGAGKTYTMAASAMEGKRLGHCSKSLFVVPNHLVSQWATEFLQLYPGAKTLAATKKDFETKNRKKFCARIATGDYDAIIIGHSQFEKIPVSLGRQMFTLQKQIDELVEGIAELKRSKGEKFTVKQLEATKVKLENKLNKLNDQSNKDDVVTFEELGVDRLYVDEAHYYKNLFVYSKMTNVGGISQVEANKSSDMFMKCQYLDELTDSKGITFATGTPISNSMVELYTMQRYLQYDLLKEYGYINFDSWAAQYGETVTAVELTPEGTGYRTKVRFARFNNLPELMSLFKECADIQTSDMLKLPVPKANYHNVSVKPSEIQVEMVKELGERAEKIRDGAVKPYEDNMLNITNDGRKLALDQRVINPALPDFEGSKINACINNIYNIWRDTSDKKSTQLVFCDLSTPTAKGSASEVTDSEEQAQVFTNVYDDIRRKLIEKGIPAEEIAFIHSANNDKQKAELFGKVRSGKVRVLLGSTQKMGAGTNVQERLIASHDIDCPWRPSDLEQRAGRIIRQGNSNPEVHIYRYVTENTFDAYLYQLVETKQKFVGQVMTSKTPVRSIEDVDEAALSYAEIKMLATGNPHIKEKMDLDIQVQNLKMLQSNYFAEKYDLEDKVTKEFPQDIARYKAQIKALEIDIKTAAEHPKAVDDSFSGMVINGVNYTEKKDAGKAILQIMKSIKSKTETYPVGSYRGFDMELYIALGLGATYILAIKGAMTHKVELGTDTFGNITRIDNCIDHLAGDLEKAKNNLAETEKQLETAKENLKEPFSREQELQEKQARLNELNALLNVDKTDNEIVDEEPDENDNQTKRNIKILER